MPRTDSATTKAAIIAAARRCFAEGAYDQVGLRDIAARAGVDKRMLTRYFGTKANIFAAALEAAQANLPNHPPDSAPSIEADLRLVFETGRMKFEERNDYLSLCLQSANSPEAKTVVREALEADILRHATSIPGGDKTLRAAMFLSVLFGVTLVREIIGARPLQDAGADAMVRHTAPILSLLLTEGSQAMSLPVEDGGDPPPPKRASSRRLRD